MKKSQILAAIEANTILHENATDHAELARIEDRLAILFYELNRKVVAGRPAWERLDAACAYDCGLKSVARAQVRAHLAQPDRVDMEHAA